MTCHTDDGKITKKAIPTKSTSCMNASGKIDDINLQDYLMFTAMEKVEDLRKSYINTLDTARDSVTEELDRVVNGFQHSSMGPLGSSSEDLLRQAAQLRDAIDNALTIASHLGYERPEWGPAPGEPGDETWGGVPVIDNDRPRYLGNV